jgi:VRR-NUC domain
VSTTTLKVSEASFQRAVIDYARASGWKVAHWHDSRREVVRKDGTRLTIGDKDAAGVPDLLLVRAGRMICAELKSEKGRVSKAQEEWLDALSAVGVEVYVWRPSEWDEVEEALER